MKMSLSKETRYKRSAEEFLDSSTNTRSVLHVGNFILFAQRSILGLFDPGVFPEYVDILGVRGEGDGMVFFSDCMALTNFGKLLVTNEIPNYIKKGMFDEELSREEFVYWLSKDPQLDRILEEVPERFAAELIASGLGYGGSE